MVLVCSQAVGAEEKTLTEWGFPPISEWEFRTSQYEDLDKDGYEEWVHELYIIYELSGNVYVHVYKDRAESLWSFIYIETWGMLSGSQLVIYEDYDHNGLWTKRHMKYE